MKRELINSMRLALLLLQRRDDASLTTEELNSVRKVQDAVDILLPAAEVQRAA